MRLSPNLLRLSCNKSRNCHTCFMKRVNCKGKQVLIIPDLHCPYHHPDSFAFLAKIKKQYKITDKDVIINLGDETDGHAISFHNSDSALPSADRELEKAIEALQELHSIFPKMYLVSSNHGDLKYRKLKHHGIPIAHLKSQKQLYGTPKWNWYDDLILDTHKGPLYVCHGRSANGDKLSGELSMSVCQGHFHSKYSITWHSNGVEDRFSLFAGSLIDRQSLAFSYGKLMLKKPILGAALITEDGTPHLIKMELNKKERWTKYIP